MTADHWILAAKIAGVLGALSFVFWFLTRQEKLSIEKNNIKLNPNNADHKEKWLTIAIALLRHGYKPLGPIELSWSSDPLEYRGQAKCQNMKLKGKFLISFNSGHPLEHPFRIKVFNSDELISEFKDDQLRIGFSEKILDYETKLKMIKLTDPDV